MRNTVFYLEGIKKYKQKPRKNKDPTEGKRQMMKNISVKKVRSV